MQGLEKLIIRGYILYVVIETAFVCVHTGLFIARQEGVPYGLRLQCVQTEK